MLVIILQGRQSCAPFNLKPSSRYYATCTRTALGTGAPEPPSRGRTRIAVADAVLRRTSHGAEEYRFACGRRGVCLVATCRVAHELAGVVLRRTLFRSYELFADAVHNLAANTLSVLRIRSNCHPSVETETKVGSHRYGRPLFDPFASSSTIYRCHPEHHRRDLAASR